ncbi:MAG TPA: hypothetical protein VF800_28540 [Telluria sp.]|jgi:ATP-binding cassette subfamily B protein RaxB
MLILAPVIQPCPLAAPFYMQRVVDEVLLPAGRDLLTVPGCGFLLLVLPLVPLQTAVRAG